MKSNNVPQVRVGIMNDGTLEFVLNGDYVVNGAVCTGIFSAQCADGKVEWNGVSYDSLLFEPADETACSFTLKNVVIGVSFHWRRKEDQTFRGSLQLIVENDKLTAINILSVE